VADVATCRTALAAGKIKNAVAACQRAIDARPAAAEPLALLAEAEFTRGRGKEALRLANAAVASDPRCADAYVIIGGVQQDLGRKEEAFAAYRRYLSISPHGAHAGELRALLASR
jgi:tetratricopeptide (TPR) repeat protein